MISVLTICLNEEEMINQYMEYVTSGIADEIVIVDGGSTDKTVPIIHDWLQRLPPTLVNLAINPMPGSFAEQRNFAKTLCRGDWILQVDVDEKYTPGLAGEIKKLTPPTTPWLGYSFPTYHLVQDEFHYSNRDTDPHVRLFRNIPEIQYHRDVHEFLKHGEESLLPHPSNMNEYSKKVIRYIHQIRLLHYSQLRSSVDKQKKWEKYEKFAERSATAGIPVSKEQLLAKYEGEVFEIPKEMLK
jgi:glycosyltransferase involved in cell wall biosynthesis